MDYTEEKNICEYLGLKIDRGNYVLAWYGSPKNDNTPTGWQVVCHLSKLKMYLSRQVHEKHYSKIKKTTKNQS